MENGERKLLKIELKHEMEDEFSKSEFDHSFGYDSPLNDLDSIHEESDRMFPLPINPTFDLDIQFQVWEISITKLRYT